jgi:hypothetical protein
MHNQRGIQLVVILKSAPCWVQFLYCKAQVAEPNFAQVRQLKLQQSHLIINTAKNSKQFMHVQEYIFIPA